MIKRVLSKMRKVTMSLFAVLCAGAVWAEEGEVTTPEVTPEPEPTPSTSALAIDPSAGYILTGLGELGDQAAVVFTNPDAVATWKAPKDLKNVEILAVGGGGGGGGHYYNTTTSSCQGGAGGGGGAVVTGFIKNLSSESTVSVTVGAGGAGGSAATADTLGVEKAENGGNTIISVDGLAYITAYGGGGDGGKDSSGVAMGGSNSGVRQNQTAVALNELAVVGTGAEDLLKNVTVYRNKGGAGYSTSSGYPGAGGGGAMEAGGASTGSGIGGSGGAGVALDITGSSVVYGSGGGGGLGKSVSGGALVGKAGVGAGAGYADEKGGDAFANQGGGGGGGSYKKNGGAGGSGIVVLRFAYFENEITVDAENNIQSKIASKPYTGAELTSGLVDTYAYQVNELAEDLVSPGKKTVRVTLNDGYVWSDGDTKRSKDFDWYIASVETFADGYKVIGLGRNGDEVALVFTKSSSWTVPANINNAQFLVVGGGGGGGADTSTKDAYSGGGGGGGGGVVAGVVSFAKGTTVTVTVGAGGAGGTGATTYSSQYGAAASGANSSFSTPAGQQVVANGGGGSGGLTKSSTRSTVESGAAGGSSAGARAKSETTSGGIGNATKGTAVGVVSYVAMGNKGGSSYGGYAGGGGGGAMTAGSSASADNTPGAGGQGYESYITGERVVYGSGGGGAKITGTGAKGGEGAGDGNPIAQSNGMSALPNQGGGGGGAGRADKGTKYKGGNGGSGIVVIRYSVKTAEVDSVAYDTLAEAFAAAEAGATVKLLNNVTLAEKITVKKAVTLDLNGCTLSETVTDSYGAIYIGTAGNLTITDSATGGKIATNGGIVVGNYGTVTVAGGTIEAGAVAEDDTSVYNFYYNGSTYGKLTVTGGKVGRIWNCGNANITAGEVVDIDNSGAMTIAEAATVSGTVIIKNGSDAAEVPGAGTLTAPESLTVQVGNDGAEAFYVDGKWLVQVVVATIGEAKYASLDAAIAAAGATDTITLVKNVELTAFVSIAKSLTLDLNGKSINRANGTALYVNGDATVTIQGEGSVSGSQAVYVSAGTVVIKGGNFHGYNGGHAVYVQGTGKVEILDGTFSIDPSGSYNYVLNKYDADRETTSIVVKGGKFLNFDPSNNGAEGANTNFCADGLKAVLNEETGYYEIVDAWTAPMPEKDGEADITEEYTPDVLAALEAAVATSVDVKVNGVELKGNEAVKALNAAVKCFDGALTFDGTAASVDIVIEVTEVNTEDPAASTVVVKRGETVLSVKTGITPTVKYIDLGSDAVVFKLVFE